MGVVYMGAGMVSELSTHTCATVWNPNVIVIVKWRGLLIFVAHPYGMPYLHHSAPLPSKPMAGDIFTHHHHHIFMLPTL